MLIDLDYIRTLKDVSKHIDAVVANEHIANAEMVELRPLIGERLYLDMSANPENYVNLLEGFSYEYNNFTYKSPGIKAVLAGFAYARIIFFGSEKSTPFGLVTKTYQDAAPVGRDRSKELYKANQQYAIMLWHDVKAYLDRKRADYQYWGSNYCVDNTQSQLGFTLKHIR